MKAAGDLNQQCAARAQQTSQEYAGGLGSGALWVIGASIAFVLGGLLVGALLKREIERALRRAVDDLATAARHMSIVSCQVASASQSLARGASEQAASLEETSACVEEINSMARRNGENSQSAAGLVTVSEQKFVKGNQSLDQMIVAINEISSQSDQISKIIKVIDEIAFQTNILALNAAVEAARAGEAGMGFAVVADEVRSLAHRCAQAAQDTSVLIAGSITRSKGGQARVDEVAGAIREVTGEAGRIKTLVEEVSLGSQEQTRGIDEIAKALSKLNQATHTTAASAQQSAAAAEQLTTQSESVNAVIGRLVALVGGTGTM